jgi:membrane fusion protein (multidrug efflux system)
MSTPSTSAPASQPTHPEAGRRRKRLLLLVAVPALVAVGSLGGYLHGGRYVETENAYVKVDKVPVSAAVAGTVAQVQVQENERVQAGQVLYRLDAAPFEVAVARAEARLAQVRTDLAALKASYREKQAEIDLARTRQRFAQRDQQRQADLVARNFISASRFDDAKLNADLAAQQVTTLEQDLRRLAEALGGSPALPPGEHPAYRAAQAELAQARLDLARIEVSAPVAGTVSKPPKVGQYLPVGSTALALMSGGPVWVEANFTETDLTHVQPGQAVAVQVDTYPDQVWHGHVDSLSPATGSEFAVIPAQNATGNWVKIAQRVPVRIALDVTPGAPVLRAGLSAVVEIDTGHRRSLLGLHI